MRKYGAPQGAPTQNANTPKMHPYFSIAEAERERYLKDAREKMRIRNGCETVETGAQWENLVWEKGDRGYFTTRETFSPEPTRVRSGAESEGEFETEHRTVSRVEVGIGSGADGGCQTAERKDMEGHELKSVSSLSPTLPLQVSREARPRKSLWGSLRKVLGSTKRLPIFDRASTLPAKFRTIGRSFGRKKMKSEDLGYQFDQISTPRMPLSAELFQPPVHISGTALGRAAFVSMEGRRTPRTPLSAATLEPPTQVSDVASSASIEHRIPALVLNRRAPDTSQLRGSVRLSDMILRAPDSIISASTPEAAAVRDREAVQDMAIWVPENISMRPVDGHHERKCLANIPQESNGHRVNQPDKRYSSATWPRTRPGRASEADQPSSAGTEGSASTRSHLRAERGESFHQTAAKVQQRFQELDDEARHVELKNQRISMAMRTAHVDQPRGSGNGERAYLAGTLPRGHRMPENHGHTQETGEGEHYPSAHTVVRGDGQVHDMAVLFYQPLEQSASPP